MTLVKKPTWVIEYFHKRHVVEADTKGDAIDHFLAHWDEAGHFNFDDIRNAILTGKPGVNKCYIYQLCLPTEVRKIFAPKLVEMLNEIDCLSHEIQNGYKKRRNEFYRKGYRLSQLLFKLESVYSSKALQYIRNITERLWSDADEKKFRLGADVTILLRAFLSKEVEES